MFLTRLRKLIFLELTVQETIVPDSIQETNIPSDDSTNMVQETIIPRADGTDTVQETNVC